MPNNDPAVPPTPTSVEEARFTIEQRVNYLLMNPQDIKQSTLDALIAAVRAEERAKIEAERAATFADVRRVVEGMPRSHQASDVPDQVYVPDVLTALDALASEGK